MLDSRLDYAPVIYIRVHLTKNSLNSNSHRAQTTLILYSNHCSKRWNNMSAKRILEDVAGFTI